MTAPAYAVPTESAHHDIFPTDVCIQLYVHLYPPIPPITSHLQQISPDKLLIERLAQSCRTPLNDSTSSLQSSNLALRSTLTPGDNGTSVAHATSGRRRDTGDKADDRLALDVVGLQELGRILLRGSSNLSDHDNPVGLFVREKNRERINEVGTSKRVTTDPTRALTVGRWNIGERHTQ
jgi:hypothetical protein